MRPIMYLIHSIQFQWPGLLPRTLNIKVMLVNEGFQTWLLTGWQEAANQPETTFENQYYK